MSDSSYHDACRSGPKGRQDIAKGEALEECPTIGQGPKGRQTLIPEISLVELHARATQQVAKLVLERDAPVMLFLVSDVPGGLILVVGAHGECSISRLPGEISETRPLVLIHFDVPVFTFSIVCASETVRDILKRT